MTKRPLFFSRPGFCLRRFIMHSATSQSRCAGVLSPHVKTGHNSHVAHERAHTLIR
jgi:hypothetical protein